MKRLALTTLLLVLPVMVLVLSALAAAAAAPGDKAPDFTLTATDGTEHALGTYLEAGNVVVLEWFNPDCPFIVKHHQNHKTMNEIYAKVQGKDVVWLAINSGAKGKEGAGLERNRKAVEDYEIPFPVLRDPTGEVGLAYGARTTPHMFVITPGGVVAYNGAIDDNRSADKLGETNYVVEALAAVMDGQTPAVTETRPYGCSVKYAK